MYYRIAIWESVGYRINGGIERKGKYTAQYKRGINSTWLLYAEGPKNTWEEAYAVLECHANPAILAVRFVGTF